jgi:DNA-binding PadR family transcriptional regulator
MTNSELILLSLISECPRHGYEIEQIIVERGMRNWTEIGFSSIYFVLKKLVKEGIASTSPAPAAGRGPAKKVFSVTPAGRAALHEGVLQSLRSPDLGDQSFLFGLSCLPLLSKPEAVESLQTRCRVLREKHEELSQQLAVNILGLPPHVSAMFTYSTAVIQAEVNWLEAYISELNKGSHHV